MNPSRPCTLTDVTHGALHTPSEYQLVDDGGGGGGGGTQPWHGRPARCVSIHRIYDHAARSLLARPSRHAVLASCTPLICDLTATVGTRLPPTQTASGQPSSVLCGVRGTTRSSTTTTTTGPVRQYSLSLNSFTQDARQPSTSSVFVVFW